MKKVYGKPTVSFEDFAFPNSIAAGCADIRNLHAQDFCEVYGTHSDHNCKFIDNVFVIFASSAAGCDFTPEEYDPGNLCYHTADSSLRVFMS